MPSVIRNIRKETIKMSVPSKYPTRSSKKPLKKYIRNRRSRYPYPDSEKVRFRVPW